MSGATRGARAVRYAASIKLHVELQPDQTDGLIRPPYIVVSYEHVLLENLDEDREATVCVNAKSILFLPTSKNSVNVLIFHRL